jgi:hypothetical protein
MSAKSLAMPYLDTKVRRAVRTIDLGWRSRACVAEVACAAGACAGGERLAKRVPEATNRAVPGFAIHTEPTRLTQRGGEEQATGCRDCVVAGGRGHPCDGPLRAEMCWIPAAVNIR